MCNCLWAAYHCPTCYARHYLVFIILFAIIDIFCLTAQIDMLEQKGKSPSSIANGWRAAHIKQVNNWNGFLMFTSTKKRNPPMRNRQIRSLILKLALKMKACRKDFHPTIIQSTFNSNRYYLLHTATSQLHHLIAIYHGNHLNYNATTHRYIFLCSYEWFPVLEYHNTTFFDAETRIIWKAFGALRLPKPLKKTRWNQL